MLTILDFTGLRAGSQCRYAAAHDDALRPDLSDVCKLRAQRCLVEDLRRTLEQLGDDPASIRDRALILVGFAGAMRRSELAALDVSDVTFIDKGIEILIRRSKTDQLGVGHVLAIQYGSSIETCPVRALGRG